MKTYIVLDLEWNQSANKKAFYIPSIPFEIIEIGAIKLNQDLSLISTFHSFIKPKIYREINPKVLEITNIQYEDLKLKGKNFKKVIKDFYNWCFEKNEEPIFCTWGSIDLYELQRNIKFYKLNLPFKKPLFYYDIQKIYLIYEGNVLSSKIPRKTLHDASINMGIDEDIDFHSAINDAHYTYLIMKRINFNKYIEYLSIDYFNLPNKKSEEIYIEFPDYSKYISMTYSKKADLIKRNELYDMLCFKCRHLLKKRINWFSFNNKFYYCIAYCPEHGYLKGKLRIKSTQSKRYYAVKTIKLITEEEYKEFIEFKTNHKQQ